MLSSALRLGESMAAPELAAVVAAEKAAIAVCRRASRDTTADPATQQLWYQVLNVRTAYRLININYIHRAKGSVGWLDN